jgi:hypothetical protein
VHFVWQQREFVPCFQFVPHVLQVRNDIQRVVVELGTEIDPWELTTWFAMPNIWLKNRSPVDVVDSDLTSVLDEARADRFVTRG